MSRIDRTIRDAEAHHRRVADLLAESRQALPVPEARSGHSPFDMTSYNAPSTFSTLRGALGESSVWEPATRVPSYTPPEMVNFGPANVDSSSINRSPVAMPSSAGTWEGLGSPRLSSRLGSSTTSALSGEHQHSTHSDHSTSNDMGSSWSLESRSRARSMGINSLRQRARPRSPSPPARTLSPWNLLTASFQEPPSSRLFSLDDGGSSFGSEGYRTAPNRASTAGVSEFATLMSEPEPPTFLGTSSPAWSQPSRSRGEGRNAAVNRAPMGHNGDLASLFAAEPEPPVFADAPSSAWMPPQRPRANIDLNAYRDGPFRATMARSMALQQQARTQPARERRSPPTQTSSVLSDEWSELVNDLTDDDPMDFLGPFTHRDWAHRPSAASRAAAAQEFLAPEEQLLATFNRPYQSEATSRSWTRQTRENEAQNPTERLREMVGRPYGVPMPARPTLLDHYRPTPSPSANVGASRPSESGPQPASSRLDHLERFEQRRDIARRVAMRRISERTPEPRPMSNPLSSRYQPQAMPSPSPASSVRRPTRNVTSGDFGMDRPAQDASAPVRGRIPRPRLGGYLPPDMISSSPFHRFRRRNLGDYMVSILFMPIHTPF